MTLNQNIKNIIEELELVFDNFKELSIKQIIDQIISSNIIITCGAGRMGLAAKAFTIRLKQLGLDSYSIGDSAIPHVTKKDLLIVCSGSGETETIVTIAKIAKKNGCKIALITSQSSSRIAKLSTTKVILNAKSKLNNKGIDSIQPMTTLMEQCTGIFFDAVVLELMKKLNKTSDDMWKKHYNLE